MFALRWARTWAVSAEEQRHTSAYVRNVSAGTLKTRPRPLQPGYVLNPPKSTSATCCRRRHQLYSPPSFPSSPSSSLVLHVPDTTLTGGPQLQLSCLLLLLLCFLVLFLLPLSHASLSNSAACLLLCSWVPYSCSLISTSINSFFATSVCSMSPTQWGSLLDLAGWQRS